MKKTKSSEKAPKSKKLIPIADQIKKIQEEMAQAVENGEEEEGMGIIRTILLLFTKGYTRKEIIKAGFNKSTVYNQTGMYSKLRNAPATQYYGYELFEKRLQRVMAAKKISREKAMEWITEQDLNTKIEKV